MTNDKILLGHGSGGRLSHELIQNLFVKYFRTETGAQTGETDSAVLACGEENIAFTTDSYVVDPIFFPEGNIGKLAVCGTVNDLSVSGAVPKFLSTSFIIEEGFSMKELETIVATMAEEAQKAGVKIVTGDTKIVNRGKCDKIFINTAGIGFLPSDRKHISYAKTVQAGDKIIINGTIGDHGMAIMAEREKLSFSTKIKSDCASLNGLIAEILQVTENVRFMRDATRGGLATVLVELAENCKKGILLNEEAIPVNENVRGICELLGFDPLYVANEGKIVIVVSENEAEKVLQVMRKNKLAENAAIIGEVSDNNAGRVILQTSIGGRRIVNMLAGEQLPRIC